MKLSMQELTNILNDNFEDLTFGVAGDGSLDSNFAYTDHNGKRRENASWWCISSELGRRLIANEAALRAIQSTGEGQLVDEAIAGATEIANEIVTEGEQLG